MLSSLSSYVRVQLFSCFLAPPSWISRPLLDVVPVRPPATPS